MENFNLIQLDFGFECEPLPPQNKTSKLNKKQENDFVFNYMDCLTSPIIVFKSAWQDTIPKDLLKNIKLSRLLCSIAARRNGIAYRNISIYDA